ncbi:hypothetical protein HYS49_03845 [Candidatus Woesearchaeota archaeon]|nr:hypothetical protein [Candidatus Woesearchaeota archaeon]
MSLRDTVVAGVLVAGALGAALSLGSALRLYGSRGTEVVYTFPYGGDAAHVYREDCRLAPDRYWVELPDLTILSRGQLELRDGGKLRFDSWGYEIIGAGEERGGESD